MKRLAAAAVLLLFLSGCSGENTALQRGMELREKLLGGNGCTYDMDVTADYGTQMHQFAMTCQGSRDGDVSFTVTAPETISGITGEITRDGGQLTFGEKALAFSLLADEQLSPVSAPWIFLKTLRSGYLTSAGMEGEQLRLTIDDSYEEDALTLDIWLDENFTPVRSDVLYDGRRILSMEIRNFAIL